MFRLSCLLMKNWELRFVYSQEENIDSSKGADWQKEKRNRLVLYVHNSPSGNFTSKFQAGPYQKLSVSKSFLILPERGQSSLLDLFIKKLKKTCLVYLAGNIRLASGKKDRLDCSWEPWQPFLLSSSFLVQGWSADSQTATHRAPNQLISFLPLDFF